MSYVPLVYRSSGGDQLNIAAGGQLSIAGVSFLTTAGYLGDQRMFFEQSSAPGVLTPYGITLIATSTDTAADQEYSVIPAAGRVKYIVSTTTGIGSRTNALTTGTWDGTNKNCLFTTGSVNPQAIMAIGISTTRWYTIPLTTDITFSNT